MFSLIIADDSPVIQNGIASYLSKMHPEFQIDGVFSDGDQVLSFLQSHRVDVIITDIVMPKTNGLNLAEYIFNHHPDTMIIFISGFSEFEYARKAINYGVFTYLLKPLDFKELSQCLSALSRRLTSSSDERTPDTAMTDIEYSDRVMQQILKYIQLHYSENITMEECANSVFLSYNYFSYFFKQRMGVCFKDYLTEFRMQKACELLRTRTQIRDIAVQVGYFSMNRFYANFKQYTGYTPKEYRIQVLNMEE